MPCSLHLDRMAGIFILFSAVTIAGCSGKATPCTENFILDPTVYGALVSPMNGATAVPASLGTLVFAAPADFSIVLKPMGGSGSTIQTSPTAVPSPYAGTGDFAVTIPTLKAGTTYAAGALSDENQCAGDDTFRTFGTFTTQ